MHQAITRQEAAQELLRRRRARESLVAFSQAIEIPGAPVSDDPNEWLFKPIESMVAKHHILFMEEVQACMEKAYGRLIIMAPPGAAKTTYSVVVAAPWGMGKWPGYKVVSTSYAQQPAERSARRCQQICRSEDYAAIWEHKAMMVRGASGVKEWSLTNDSTMLSAGLLGGITSSRADLGLIDDPVAGREEADSPTIRRKTRQAYDDDFLTRLKPAASIILFMTRWQEDDLVGSILPADYKGQSGDILCRDGQVWRVINLPAEAEHKDDPLGRKPGEMLWPEWFTTQHWAIFRSNVRTWSALYQQRPAPDTGGLFEKKDFKRYRETPEGLRWYLSSDWAVTELQVGEKPDYTQHVMGGINDQAELFLDDGWGGREDPAISTEKALDLGRRYKPVEWLIEQGGILNATKGMVNRAMRDSGKTRDEAGRLKKQIFIPIEPMPSSGHKIAKVTAFRARCKMGMVWVREGTWGDTLIQQLCAFPYSTFDDIVDACGQLGRRIDDMYASAHVEPDTREKIARRGSVRSMSADALEAIARDEKAEARRRKAFMG